MTQKILVKLHVHCDKCRTKALKIAATAPGVNKVSIQGEHRDHVEVIGDVDSVCLTRALRKKLGSADLVKVEQVK
ncbi:heavy metal-associated isoprenylated plant protein 16 [Rosa sericea]|uniref:Putative heavy metal-associated domain, HMA n=1 Tax=Rosa chinensis TaxID=74649 RepID=A0A2P6QLF7_ROSCH|nr:heavy metal-associated isoprenylated plant protein 16 [Rosa chinensis]PRQ35005.1 putative heavy metal-associated domain, HMA [Rosa chinensis]